MASLQLNITDILIWYDGPQIVKGILPRTDREFLMVAVGRDFKGVAIELSSDDMKKVLSNQLTLQQAYIKNKIGPFYYGIIVGNGCMTEITSVSGNVPQEFIPGDVMIQL